jgi:hypothetical protein
LGDVLDDKCLKQIINAVRNHPFARVLLFRGEIAASSFAANTF